MGLEGVLLLVTTVLLGYTFQYFYNKLYLVQPIPEFETTWWGPGEPAKENLSVMPFQINISQEVLLDLKDRLHNHRPFTPPLENVTHEYGLNSIYFAHIVKYWIKNYNWAEREYKLNLMPQYTTKIQGLNIHFIRTKPNEDIDDNNVVTLLLLHDWPNTNMEFSEVIPILNTTRNNYNFGFEIIAPSLPGFGFSDKPVKPGLGVVQLAVLLNNFMKRLGRRRYYIHGEGWGGVIAENMALLYPKRVLGVHSNWCMALKNTAYLKILLGSRIRWLGDKNHYNKMYPLKLSQFIEESSYLHFQAIKPDTIGIGLGDSPIGLAAYIVDIFASHLKYNSVESEIEYDKIFLKYSYDQLLDNIMIYWVTESITTSMRIFAEYYQQFDLISKMNKHYIRTPFVCSRLQNEVIFQTSSILKERYKNLVEITDMPFTTRFPALEEPRFLANDIWYYISKILIYNSKIEKENNLKLHTKKDEF